MRDLQINPDDTDIPDPTLGLRGPAEPLPDHDHLRQRSGRVTDEDPDR